MTITIATKLLGSKRSLLPNWNLPVPPEFTEGPEPVTLRQLITYIVLAELEAFRKRERDRHLVRVLTQQEIADGVEKGKVDPGGHDPGALPNPEEAVGAALQAFEDGIYLVLLDGEEQRELDREIYMTENCTITFLRLTMLAGG